MTRLLTIVATVVVALAVSAASASAQGRVGGKMHLDDVSLGIVTDKALPSWGMTPLRRDGGSAANRAAKGFSGCWAVTDLAPRPGSPAAGPERGSGNAREAVSGLPSGRAGMSPGSGDRDWGRPEPQRGAIRP